VRRRKESVSGRMQGYARSCLLKTYIHHFPFRVPTLSFHRTVADVMRYGWLGGGAVVVDGARRNFLLMFGQYWRSKWPPNFQPKSDA
jgi:hypothetical protein